MAINQSNFKDKMNEWMTIEDKIEKLNKDIKKLRDEKTSKEQKLIEYMKSSNLSNKVIKLNNQIYNFLHLKLLCEDHQQLFQVKNYLN